MTFNKITRTLIPTITGYLTFLLCDKLFQNVFPTEALDDLSTPGIVFLLEYVVMFVWIIIVFTFQYKVVVPKTHNSTKKAITLTVIIGLGISIFFAFMHYTADNGIFKEIVITFLRVFIQVESFVLGNLTLIAIFNNLTNKTENKQAI
jgi:hypothetical protein